MGEESLFFRGKQQCQRGMDGGWIITVRRYHLFLFQSRNSIVEVVDHCLQFNAVGNRHRKMYVLI